MVAVTRLTRSINHPAGGANDMLTACIIARMIPYWAIDAAGLMPRRPPSWMAQSAKNIPLITRSERAAKAEAYANAIRGFLPCLRPLMNKVMEPARSRFLTGVPGARPNLAAKAAIKHMLATNRYMVLPPAIASKPNRSAMNRGIAIITTPTKMVPAMLNMLV